MSFNEEHLCGNCKKFDDCKVNAEVKEVLDKHKLGGVITILVCPDHEQSPGHASSFSSKGEPCPKCKKGIMMDDVCPDELLCHACGYTEALKAH